MSPSGLDTDGELGLEAAAGRKASAPVGASRKLWRALMVVRNYRFDQVARRGVKLIWQRSQPRAVVGVTMPKSPAKLGPFSKTLQEVASVVISSYARHISHSKGDLPQGRLSLLCESRELGWPIGWHAWTADAAPSHLWRFHLHYHEFLLSNVADETGRGANPWPVVEAVLQSWVDRHDVSVSLRTSDAWHPYCISRRIAAWTWLLVSAPRDSISQETIESYWLQADYLSRNLELDLGGNHLIENLTALAIAAAVLECEEARTWNQIAKSYLEKELARQVLPHGEHFERSPVYHCQILGNLLLIILLSRDEHLEQLCRNYADPMLKFIFGILLDDGEVPLFADSVFGESPSITRIRQLADLAGFRLPEIVSRMSRVGGYVVFRREKPKLTVVVDGGAVGARELPAHAHCDLMNLEVCYDGVRWITDTGNFDYEDSSMRHFCRSSSAHSVMTIGGENHCDIWSKFRMVDQGEITGLTQHSASGFSWCVGEYRVRFLRQWVTLHRIVVVAECGELIVADAGPTSLTRPLVGYVQLGPEIAVNVEGSSAFSLSPSDGSSQKQLILMGCGTSSVETGWFCPAFGLRQTRNTVKYQGAGDATCGWMLKTKESRLDVALDSLGLHIANEGGEPLHLPFR